MNIPKIAVGVIIWEFMVGMFVLFTNTAIFGYFEPTMEAVVNATLGASGLVDYQTYMVPVKAGMNIALFVFAILPFLYLFVRLWFKKEQTVQETYNPAWSYPESLPDLQGATDNRGGNDVSI